MEAVRVVIMMMKPLYVKHFMWLIPVTPTTLCCCSADTRQPEAELKSEPRQSDSRVHKLNHYADYKYRILQINYRYMKVSSQLQYGFKLLHPTHTFPNVHCSTTTIKTLVISVGSSRDECF